MGLTPIEFGTDGWRAVIAEAFTFANLDRVTQATATHWLSNPIPGTERKVIVGYDRRFLSDQFAGRAAEIFCRNGFSTILTKEPTPTPAVSFAVKAHRAVGGVMITASHNPPSFNGFKLKAHFGGSAESSTSKAIEALLDVSSVPEAHRADGGAPAHHASLSIQSLRRSHLMAIRKLVDLKLIRSSKLRFAHEALFGVGAGCFDELLAGSRCRVTTLNGEHDPFFGGINPEPVASNYARSSEYLRRHPHDICLVTDGDADRVGGMDGRGRPLSTHQIICLLLQHLVKHRSARGRVIKALTTTSMLDSMCAAYGLELIETRVGFKYVAAEMLRGSYVLGAEESGGIGFPGHIPERDGILAGLMLLEMLAMSGEPINRMLARLEREFGPHHYARLDTHFPFEQRSALVAYCRDHPPAKLAGSPVVDMKTYDGVKYIARNGSWLMLRGSGTEPILRIYSEAASEAGARALLRQGQKLTRNV